MNYTDLNTFVVQGQRYVVSFNWSGLAVPQEDLQNISAGLASMAANPIVRSSGTVGGYIDWEFTAATVTTFGIYVQTILDALDELYGQQLTATWMQACDAPCGLVSGSECGINNLGACVDQVTSGTKTAAYLIIAILVLVVVVKVT